jgi:acyl carrier protein
MKISDLTDILKKQFPEEEISNSSSGLGVGSFLQWDSLGHYNLLLLVEESYGVRFTIEEMSEMKSLSDIAEVLALKGVKD